MTRPAHPGSEPVQVLRKAAMGYPEAQEGIVCSKAAFKARNKAFLFLGTDDISYNILLKLRESLPEATELATAEPKRYGVGVHGWVSATFRRDESPPPGLLERWIDESYRLLAPRKLVALLPERGSPTSDFTGPAARKAY